MSPQQIRTIRAWFNLTQQELADKVGVSANTVARWEGGDRNPSRPVVKLLQQLWEQMKGESAAA